MAAPQSSTHQLTSGKSWIFKPTHDFGCKKKNIFQFSGVSNFFCTKNYPIFWLKVSSQSGFLLGQKDPFSGGVAYLSRNLCQDGRFNLFGFGQSC